MIYGIGYLRQKLAQKASRVRLRYKYYDMKNGIKELSGIIPAEFKNLSEMLGWCAKSVDSLADRLQPDGFVRDDFLIGEIYRLNNSDILFDSAILSALISSCSFIYIGYENGYPTIEVIDGENATGVIDPTTFMLTEGYAVLERDRMKKPLREAYFTAHETVYYERGKVVERFAHKAPYALLVPVINRPDAKRPFGHSRISRACMELTQGALRTLRRSEICGEFYSFPQKYLLGLDKNAEFNGRAATLSTFLLFDSDEDGNKPTIGQFSQQSMAPFIDHIKMFASLFAGETGLTLDDLGFPQANPSSFDAIRALHEPLRLTARKAQRTFGVGFLNAGYLAACLRDKYEYDRRAFANIQTAWLPIFEPDASALTGLADAIYKINEAFPDFLNADDVRRLTGLRGASND